MSYSYYEPMRGDVIEYEGALYVVLDRQDFEDERDAGAYNRKYKLCPLDEFFKVYKDAKKDCLTGNERRKLISEEDFEKLGQWIYVHGYRHPEMKRRKDVLPYKIGKMEILYVEPKVD